MPYPVNSQTLAVLTTGPVRVERAAPVLDFVLDCCEDLRFRRYIRDLLEYRDLEKASRKPVVNVTVAGVPGMFRADLEDNTRAWVAP